MRKKEISLIGVLLFSFFLTELQGQTTLNLNDNLGIKTAFLLGTVQKLTFPSGNMQVIKKDGNTQTFIINNIDYINFSSVENGIIETNILQNQLVIYPNPVLDILNIEVPSSMESAAQLEIVGIDGKVIFKRIMSIGTRKIQISVSDLPKGLYLCRCINDKGISNNKFFK